MKEALTSEKVGKLNKEIVELSYEDFRNGDIKLVNDIINRWKRIGLTYGLDEEMEKECAFYFEQMSVYLIYEKDIEEADEKFETAVFPMIRRVLQEAGTLNGVFKPADFEKFYYDNVEECNKAAKEKGVADEEAEALCLLCDKYVEKLKKEHGGRK